MRRWPVLALALALVSCGEKPAPGPAPGQPAEPAANQPQKYGVKSGIVHYELGSKIAKMTKVLYFDDFGAKECCETSYEGKLTETQFTDGQDRYTIRAEGEKVAWNQGKAVNGIAMKVSAKGMAGQRGVSDLPAMTLCGKECEAYAVKTGKQTVTFAGWQGVLMLMQTDDQQGAYEKALQAEFGVPVPADKFRVPAGHEVRTL